MSMATMMDDGEIVTDNGLMQGGCAQWLACHAWDRTSWHRFDLLCLWLDQEAAATLGSI